jgi:hypothetical protein
VDDILQDGQLEETELTLSDLRKVSDTFLRVLANIFHQRIDYPGFDFNAGAKREKRTAAGEILETVDPEATIVDEAGLQADRDAAARAS